MDQPVTPSMCPAMHQTCGRFIDQQHVRIAQECKSSQNRLELSPGEHTDSGVQEVCRQADYRGCLTYLFRGQLQQVRLARTWVDDEEKMALRQILAVSKTAFENSVR
jgi:hypothetical protein